MYATRENVQKFGSEYAAKKEAREAFENVPAVTAAGAGATASAAAWSTEEKPSDTVVPETAAPSVAAPANTFCMARYSDSRGFVTYPITAGSVRRHLEAALTAAGSEENANQITISAPSGAEVTTGHVKVTWVDLPSPLLQVGAHTVPVSLRYFESEAATESLAATVNLTINIKHRDTA